jgi:hypothetical protein
MQVTESNTHSKLDRLRLHAIILQIGLANILLTRADAAKGKGILPTGWDDPSLTRSPNTSIPGLG